MAQPTDLQTQMNTVQWTNGRQAITGSFIMGLFALIMSIFSGMGTWTNGSFSASVNSASIVAGLGFTPVNKAGDAADALYTTPVGAGTSAGLPVQLKRGCYFADAYGADPAGATNSDAALAAIVGQIGTGNGCIQFGFGKYTFGSQVAATLSASSINGIRILGAGSAATQLYWPNAGGGFSFALNAPTNFFDIENLTLLAGTPGGSTAIRATNAAALNANGHSQIRDVSIKGRDRQIAPASASTQYWDNCVWTTTVSFINIDALDCFGDSSSHGTGIRFEGATNSYAILENITNSNLIGLNYGIYAGTWQQGIQATNVNFTNGNTAVYLPSTALNTNQLNVVNSQINTNGRMIDIEGQLTTGQFTNNYFISLPNSVPIFIQNGHGYVISSNAFDGQGAGSTCIYVNGNDTYNASTILGNSFYNCGNAALFSAGTTGWTYNVAQNAYNATTSQNTNFASPGANQFGTPQSISGGSAGAGINASSTAYMGLISSTTEANAALPAVRTGTLKALAVSQSAAPGGSASVTYTLRANGTATLFTCTIAASATSCTDANAAHAAYLYVGQTYDVQAVASSGAATAAASYTIEFDN